MSDVNVWTVKPDSVQLDLVYNMGGGETRNFWIRAKKYLNIGEKRRVSTAGFRSMSKSNSGDADANAEIQIDWRAQTFARTEAYVTDWSLKSEGVPLTREGMESLEEDVYLLIENALTAHIEEMDRQKKVKNGKIALEATSTS